MLHTISSNHIDIHLINQHDAVLLWQNGVIFALNNNAILQAILQKTEHCYVLNNDLVARGLMELVDQRINVIDMDRVVELTEQFYPQLNHA